MKKIVILISIVLFALVPFMGCQEEEPAGDEITATDDIDVQEPADARSSGQEPADDGSITGTDDVGDFYAEPVSEGEIQHMRQEAVNRIIHQIENSRYGTPDSWMTFEEIKQQFPVMTDEFIKGVFVDSGDIFYSFDLYMGTIRESPYIPTYGHERWFDAGPDAWILIRGPKE